MFWTAAALLAFAAAAFAAAPLRRPWRLRRPSSQRGGAGQRGSQIAQSPDGEQGGAGDDAQRDGGAMQGSGQNAQAGRRQRQTGRALAVRALYRQRLEELAEESRAGLLDEASRAEMEQELAQGLLRDFAPDEGIRPDRPSRLWAPVALAVPLAALALYLHLGEPQAGMLRGAAAVLDLDPHRDRLELDRWRLILSERLAAEPEDGQSRYLLGHVLLKEGSYQPAAAAFALAQKTVGDDPSIDWHWFQALYLANQGQLDDTARGIAQRILGRDPNQAALLEILILDAYRRGEYRESVSLLNRALAIPGDPHRQIALAALMKQARAMLGDLQPSIDLRLAAEQPPPAEATLFVIARPPGGGMPFAVVRRPAAPLPKAVRLDDAVSMNPAAPLSAAAEVEVIARISLTGAATPHPGDWQWRSDPLSLTAAAEPVQLAAQLRPPG